MNPRRTPATLSRQVAQLVGTDGSDNLRVIVDQALRHNPRVTARTIARIVRQAQEDWQAERDR